MDAESARARMRRIGTFIEELNDRATSEAAALSPGRRIEAGLELSRLARAASQHDVPKEDPVPLVRLWRMRKAKST